MKNSVSSKLRRNLACASITLIVPFLSTPASAADLTITSNMYEPVRVIGSNFIACPDDTDYTLPNIKVDIIDTATGAVLASRDVSPTQCRYIAKKDLWIGGGTFSTSFSLDELSVQRDFPCAPLTIRATSTAGDTAAESTILSFCIN